MMNNNKLREMYRGKNNVDTRPLITKLMDQKKMRLKRDPVGAVGNHFITGEDVFQALTRKYTRGVVGAARGAGIYREDM